MPGSTADRLAQALAAANAPVTMVAKARAGYYDDYRSELAMALLEATAPFDFEAMRQVLEADMAPEHVAHLRATEARLIRVSDKLGPSVAIEVLRAAIERSIAGEGRAAELMDQMLTLIEHA